MAVVERNIPEIDFAESVIGKRYLKIVNKGGNHPCKFWCESCIERKQVKKSPPKLTFDYKQVGNPLLWEAMPL